jgi:hypothetical protein
MRPVKLRKAYWFACKTLAISFAKNRQSVEWVAPGRPTDLDWQKSPGTTDSEIAELIGHGFVEISIANGHDAFAKARRRRREFK